MNEPREVCEKITRVFVENVTPENVKALILNRRGNVYKNFPSRKVAEWAEKIIERELGIKPPRTLDPLYEGVFAIWAGLGHIFRFYLHYPLQTIKVDSFLRPILRALGICVDDCPREYKKIIAEHLAKVGDTVVDEYIEKHMDELRWIHGYDESINFFVYDGKGIYRMHVD